MNLIHLPTLDGSPEAAVARLDAIGRLQDISDIEDGVWQASNIVREVVDLVSSTVAYEKATRLHAAHETVLTNVQHEIDRLVSP